MRGSIAQISNFHNFDFTGGNCRAWNAYKIGSGRELPVVERTDALPRLDPIHAVGTGGRQHNSLLTTGEHWGKLTTKSIPETEQRTEGATPTEGWVADESDQMDHAQEPQPADASASLDNPEVVEGRHRLRLFQCDEEGCTKTYQKFWNWQRHVLIGKHTKQPERQSLRDYSIKTYADNIQNNLVRPFPIISEAIRTQANEEARPDDVDSLLPEGWALKVRKPVKQFTAAQKAFLHEKFDEGARTKRKYDPHDVAKLMRKDPRFPSRSDWLTWTQIASFWSRLSSNRERSAGEAGAASAATLDSEDYDLEEVADNEYANAFNEHIDEAIRSVIEQVLGRE